MCIRDRLRAARNVLHPEPDDRGAQDVARVEVGRVDPGRDLLFLTVADRLEAAQTLHRVALRVQRRVEVRLQLRSGRPKVDLVIRAPGPADRLDRGGDVGAFRAVSYTHLRAHETVLDL